MHQDTKTGLADAAVARALALPQRCYSAYVNETRKPDFATLLRICPVLRTTPDAVLDIGPHAVLPAGNADGQGRRAMERLACGLFLGMFAYFLAAGADNNLPVYRVSIPSVALDTALIGIKLTMRSA